MNKAFQGLMASIIIAFFVSTASGLNVSLLDESSSLSNLEYDRTTPNGFFDGFSEDFERPEKIGSNSFTDNSLVSPNILLSYESETDLSGEEMDVYYKSFSGSLERSVSTQPVILDGASGEKEIEISAFEALYPGKLYASTSAETAEIEGGLLDGSYLVSTDTSQRSSTTEVTVEEAFSSDGDQIHEGHDLSEDLLVSIVRNGSAVAENEVSLYGTEEFNTVLEGNETIYVNNISALETRKASPCTTLDIPNSYYVIDSSVFNADPEGPGGGTNSCLKIEADDITVDFGDSVLDGDGNYTDREVCGVKISDSDNVQINDIKIQQFSRGLCIENSSQVTVGEGAYIEQNQIGVHSNGSEASITGITSLNVFEEYVGVEGSTVELANYSFDSTNASISGENITVDDNQVPEDPKGYENTGNVLNITGGSSSLIENISFYYESKPDVIYSTTEEKIFDSGKTNSTIFLTDSIQPPTLIGTYIESEEEDEEQPGQGGGGSGGGGSGGGGGALPPGPPPGVPGGPPDNVTDPGRPPWVPANLAPEQIPRVNLSANDTVYVQQGKSFELPFNIYSTGNVSAADINVNMSTPSGWRSTETFFDEILPGESSRGQLYADVFEAELLQSYQVRLEASTVINSTFVSLDNKTVEVVVEPREKVRDLYILEGPFRMNITEGTAKTESFDLRNSGDYRLDKVSMKSVGLDRCIEDIRGSWSFDEGVEKEFNYTFLASQENTRCDGSLLFYSESEELLGIVPAEINVIDIRLKGLSNYLLPWLVLIWSLFTVHRIWRWKHERRRE